MGKLYINKDIENSVYIEPKFIFLILSDRVYYVAGANELFPGNGTIDDPMPYLPQNIESKEEWALMDKKDLPLYIHLPCKSKWFDLLIQGYI